MKVKDLLENYQGNINMNGNLERIVDKNGSN